MPGTTLTNDIIVSYSLFRLLYLLFNQDKWVIHMIDITSTFPIVQKGLEYIQFKALYSTLIMV